MVRDEGIVRSMLRNVILLVVVIVGVLLAGCADRTTQLGMLEGSVKIGPVWPGPERPDGNPPVSPQVFEARKIMIYDSQGVNLIKKVDIEQIDQSRTGYYQVHLNPGTYMVDINHTGMDRSGDVPKKIEIKAGETVKVDIDIDTGMR